MGCGYWCQGAKSLIGLSKVDAWNFRASIFFSPCRYLPLDVRKYPFAEYNRYILLWKQFNQHSLASDYAGTQHRDSATC